MIARTMRFVLLFLISLLASPGIRAHGVEHRIERGDALILTIRYSNGEPLAQASYSLYRGDAPAAVQTGRTDALGRVFFLDDDSDLPALWRIEVHARDGHGLKRELSLPPRPLASEVASAPEPAPVVPVAPEEPGPNKASLALFGFSLILGGFGLYQLLLRRRTD